MQLNQIHTLAVFLEYVESMQSSNKKKRTHTFDNTYTMDTLHVFEIYVNKVFILILLYITISAIGLFVCVVHILFERHGSISTNYILKNTHTHTLTHLIPYKSMTVSNDMTNVAITI